MNFNNENSGLKMITVDKGELMSSIAGNLKQHKADYEIAIEGFKKEYVETLKQKLDSFESNGKISTIITFDEPESHEEDYASILEMLDMSVDDEVEITYEQFQRYVRDNWSWKSNFLATTAKYR